MDFTFHPTLVEPFYLHFMRANIVGLDPAGADRLMSQFKSQLSDYSAPVLSAMLAHSWRPAKVAAWAIAADRRVEFLPELCERLLKTPSHVDHVCIALARLGGEPAGAALLDYVNGCADGRLQSNPWDESVDPDWAIAALESMDVLPDPLLDSAMVAWSAFLGRQTDLLERSFARRLPDTRGRLNDALRLLQIHFE